MAISKYGHWSGDAEGKTDKLNNSYITIDVLKILIFTNWIVIKYYTNIPCDCGQYTRLLNDEEFCFSLIGLNRIFPTLPQSEYTSCAVSIPRMQWVHLAWGIFEPVSIFVYCLFGVSTLSNQRRDFIFSRPIKLQKKVNFFFKVIKML
jgi:hypothetical protein